MKKVVLAVIVLYSIFFSYAGAADFTLPIADEALNLIPAPVKEFIDSARGIGADIFGKASDLKFDLGALQGALQTPANVYDKADGWFLETTGLRILEALKFIGNIIVWFLELFLRVFRWFLSLI